MMRASPGDDEKEETTDYPSRPTAATKKLEPQISQISQIKKNF
jgi:hypothetical protein